MGPEEVDQEHRSKDGCTGKEAEQVKALSLTLCSGKTKDPSGALFHCWLRACDLYGLCARSHRMALILLNWRPDSAVLSGS